MKKKKLALDAGAEVVTTEGGNNLRTYSKKEMRGYLTGMTGQNIIYSIIGGSLAYFLQYTILIPAAAVGIVMVVARIWDALNDPIMGTFVDKTRTKWGKCRPYLMIVPIPITIVTILCFTSFGFYGESSTMNAILIAWMSFTYILWGMLYTVGDIPLWGAPALMTEDSHDRNKLLSFARLVGGIGAGIATLAIQPIAFFIRDFLKDSQGLSGAQAERWGFLIAVAVFAIIGGALFQVVGFAIKEKIPSSEVKPGVRENFKIMLRNKPFRQILFSGILGSTKNTIMIVALPIVSYYFASKDALMGMIYLILLGGAVLGGSMIAQAFTYKLVQRFPKRKLYNASNLVCVIPFLMILGLYLLFPKNLTDPWLLAVLFVLFLITGSGTGLTTSMQSLMIADAIDYEEYHYGHRPDGVFFSGQTFIAKLTAGIATIAVSAGYAIVNFSDARIAEVNAYIDAGGIPRMADQYQGFMLILFILVTVLPAIGCILSVIPTWKYALDNDEHKRIVDELNIRRHQRDDSQYFDEEGNFIVKKSGGIDDGNDGASDSGSGDDGGVSGDGGSGGISGAVDDSGGGTSDADKAKPLNAATPADKSATVKEAKSAPQSKPATDKKATAEEKKNMVTKPVGLPPTPPPGYPYSVYGPAGRPPEDNDKDKK